MCMYLKFKFILFLVTSENKFTQYWSVDQPDHVQKYDLDPGAKAAAASVLAYKMGAETGLKVHLRDEAKSDSVQARSNEVEVVPTNGMRNRMETKAKGSYSSTTTAQTHQDTSNEAGGSGMEAVLPAKFVGHYQGSDTSDGGWIAKFAALLVGEDPSQSYALICDNCRMHNGTFITKFPPQNWNALLFLPSSHVAPTKLYTLHDTWTYRIGQERRFSVCNLLLPPLPGTQHVQSHYRAILRLRLRPVEPSCSCWWGFHYTSCHRDLTEQHKWGARAIRGDKCWAETSGAGKLRLIAHESTSLLSPKELWSFPAVQTGFYKCTNLSFEGKTLGFF